MFVDWQWFRRRALASAALAMGLVFLIWNIPQLDFALYPFRLFVTFIHESGHGLAAMLTGGDFISFQVGANGSGLATTRGGSRAVILPAGYLSSTLFGAVLLYITNRVPYPRLIAVLLGLYLLALSLLYGQTSEVALTVGVAFALSLGVVGLAVHRFLVVFVLNLLAMMTALNAVLDLFFLTRDASVTTPDGRVLNDAAAFAVEVFPGTSAGTWAWVWALFSVMMLSAAVYRSIVRPILSNTVIKRQSPLPTRQQPDGFYYEEVLVEGETEYHD